MTSERWRRTEEVFHGALARLDGERAAFLAEACSGDEALRREVESLLNETSVDDGFLDTPLGIVPAQLDGHVTPGEMAGRTLGTYQLGSLLGSGGMGDVYRARDTTLERDVAVKILPHAFTSRADRLARFEREARMLAALNHPHICGIHGIEEADGLRFLVLELVDGKTLADTLAWVAVRSPPSRGLALEVALNYAQQIAAALEAAHGRGIIHRDLKPSNIIVTPDGIAKVLDFGLAKPLPGETSSGDLTKAPPDSTVPGGVMGTAAYMSPEQAAGRPVDRRTDIWAFGVVLFEMVAGQRPFAGDTATETLASVLKTDPNWSALPANVTRDLARLIRRCLQKDPQRRLQSIADARVQIEDVLTGASDEPLAASHHGSRRQNAVPWLVAGALAIGLAGTLVWNLRSVSRPVTRLGLALPASHRLDGSGGGHILSLSPDGVHVAFVATPAGIYLRSMFDERVKLISGTEIYGSVREPVFSPDGSSIAFFAHSDQTLKRVSIAGGLAVTICPAKNPYGISWGPDGIVFGQGSEGIMRVSPDSGAPARIVTVKDDEIAHGPQLLPGGRLLFTLATGAAADRWDKARIVVQSLQSGEQTTVIRGASDARYVPTGHLMYAVGGSLFAVPFDERRLKITGDPLPIVEGVRRAAANWSGAANVSISNTGSLAYIPGPPSPGDALMDIALIDRRTGMVDALHLPARRYAAPRLSPDGAHIAFGTEDGKEASVWIYRLGGTLPMQRLTLGGNNRFPVWTSANTVAFQSDRDGDLAIFRQSIGGSAERLTKPDPGTTHAPQTWSATTNTLLFSVRKARDLSLSSLSLAAGRQVTPFTAVSPSTPTYDPGASFSPDGRWVAYASADKGATTIYVQPFPATGAKYQLVAKATDGPHEPVWSPDGTELFYNPRLGGFEAVSVTTTPAFAFGNPVLLRRRFQMGPPGSRTNYDITRDGRFVGLITAGRTEYDGGSDDRIQFVLNWFEDLKPRPSER